MEVLVVVDVQPQFERSDTVIIPCLELVEQFVEEQRPIFIVEYVGFGQTFDALVLPLVEYPKAFFIRKNEMDGSQQIWTSCMLMGMQDVGRFHVCGIYRNECVLSTVIGLANKFPNAEVIGRDEAIDKVPDSPMWERLEPQVQLQKPKPPTLPKPSGGMGAANLSEPLVIYRVGGMVQC